MANQLGQKISLIFERLKITYRPGGEDNYFKKTKLEYRQYLLGILASTYFVLEGMHRGDLLKAVNYVQPDDKKMNEAAVQRGRQLSEIFTKVTNPQWQEIYWKAAQKKLRHIHAGSKKPVLHLPSDPLDLNSEFAVAEQILAKFGL